LAVKAAMGKAMLALLRERRQGKTRPEGRR